MSFSFIYFHLYTIYIQCVCLLYAPFSFCWLFSVLKVLLNKQKKNIQKTKSSNKVQSLFSFFFVFIWFILFLHHVFCGIYFSFFVYFLLTSLNEIFLFFSWFFAAVLWVFEVFTVGHFISFVFFLLCLSLRVPLCSYLKDIY